MPFLNRRPVLRNNVKLTLLHHRYRLKRGLGQRCRMDRVRRFSQIYATAKTLTANRDG